MYFYILSAHFFEVMVTKAPAQVGPALVAVEPPHSSRRTPSCPPNEENTSLNTIPTSPKHGVLCTVSQDLIKKLLTVNPKKRITAAQAITHPWLFIEDADLVTHNVGANLEQPKLSNVQRKQPVAIDSVSVAIWSKQAGTGLRQNTEQHTE